ncbi:hypothetical protein AWH62_05825 [Maricaulis sp. W15]|nr:hypothetical protein AWH62_05825 [Maricaulis sp. W15]
MTLNELAVVLFGLALMVSEPADSDADSELEFTLHEPGYEATANIDPQIALDRDVLDAMQRRAREILSAGREINEGNVERYDVEWALISSTPEVMSVLRTEFLYQGGAHGEMWRAAELWNRGTGRLIEFETLFAPESLDPAIAAINEAIATDLERQKMVRGRHGGVADRIRTATTFMSPPTFAPSTEIEVFGGLTFWSGSYGLGGYAEGPYALTVPQSVFREFLAEPFRAWFGGDPVAALGRQHALMCGTVALVGCEQTD